MLKDYLLINFTTLMILLVLGVTMLTNHGLKIPFTRLYYVLVLLLFSMTILEYLETMGAGKVSCVPAVFGLNDLIRIRLLACTALYVLRPFVILLQLILIIGDKGMALLFSIPAVINTFLYLPSAFGARFVFWIDENNHWQATAWNRSVYVVQLFYVITLFFFSINRFRKKNRNLGQITLTIVILAFGVAILETSNVLTGYTTTVSAMCVLTYYIYLASIYRQQLYEELLEKEKQLAADRKELLRSRIQPHFIYNSVNVIRTLVRTDQDQALETIDHFSDYLKAHFRNIESDNMISFESEIENVKAFLALAEADHSRELHVVYDLQVTDFRLPQLSLEPIVENAVKHGIGENGGTITITSFRDGGNVIVRTTDSGSGATCTPDLGAQRVAIGISNTKKRLELLCNGKLEVNITPRGTTADIIIPTGAKGND